MLSNLLKLSKKINLILPYIFAFVLRGILSSREYFIVLGLIYLWVRYKNVVNREVRLKTIIFIMLNFLISIIVLAIFGDFWIIVSIILSFAFSYFLEEGILILIYPFLFFMVNAFWIIFTIFFLPLSDNLKVIL
ncbi:hypothetical protein STFE110948_01780 [Streptobacillus felis]|uniref:Uncharacterized protein n=1 Tax=Streptobacillus felis TaxID=1384509 RepID=A0A7Z0PHU5_9FUSO|nr:hypothetical protein [Streptobacillus felis]NYV28485.1 hypothetical protein [Streptobacillus felis]